MLQIRDLSIGFASVGKLLPAVTTLNLEVYRGEILALVGESGSGKSITALSVLQLLPQPPALYTGGAILFGETQPINLLAHPRMEALRGNRIGMVFQEPMSALNPVMTCGRQVAEVLVRHKKISSKQARLEAISWLGKVQIPGPEAAYDKYPHQMSGGQKQRVMIAMAICCKPDLLICDEPTTALDVTVQNEILLLLSELQQESGMGVLFITHDLGVVRQIAHRVAIMYRGKLVETGSTGAVFNNPQQAYTRALLACRPSAQQPGTRLPVVADFLEKHQVQEVPLQVTKMKATGKVLAQVKDLVVRYTIARNIWGKATRQFQAVDGVSFELLQGETLGLVGESGCGKTTLGRTLLGLEQPSEGSICINGRDITRFNKQEWKGFRKAVQLVFQDPFAALNPRLTIGDALAEPLQLSGNFLQSQSRAKRVRQLLDLVQLPADAARRYPHEFSGGQRQRIVIARALATEPGLLVCDESVSALDVSVQAQVLNLLNDLKAELGLTLLFISHDLSVVRYISNRIMVMQAGRIVESGDAATVFTNPQHAYTRQLLAAVPKI
ncbi:peptide/nickel transport system ATP-binding protein [Cnuella takakiae]|uniref:Peptide/nickel transport system ATP-binding protein n=1 Tax=Cnuella takakiae TaxID=1302690 RepID=A0A1M4YJX9_9BACT|nr:peptide/nickel transport system ATP-binding protein [Cnuella takakiae]